MLATPAAFVPLVSQRSASQTHLFVFRGGELLVRESDLELPDESAGLALGIRIADALPVGMLGPRYCCTARVERETAPPTGLAFKNLRALFGVLDEELLGVAGRAFQVAEWARTHRYCGVCGTPTFAVTGERCSKCPACGHVAYPRISPAMMVLIKRDNAILLARHLHSPTNRFTALAGFVEPGESIEDAIHREVFEEVGLTVGNLRYFASQSWPFPHSLMIAFTADYTGGEIALDANEIAEARWFGPDDPLPDVALRFSVAGELIHTHRPRRA